MAVATRSIVIHRADLVPEGIDHPVDVVAVDRVETHPIRRLELMLELEVPRERRSVEAMKQGDQASVPVFAAQIDAVDPLGRQTGRPAFRTFGNLCEAS